MHEIRLHCEVVFYKCRLAGFGEERLAAWSLILCKLVSFAHCIYSSLLGYTARFDTAYGHLESIGDSSYASITRCKYASLCQRVNHYLTFYFCTIMNFITKHLVSLVNVVKATSVKIDSYYFEVSCRTTCLGVVHFKLEGI